MSHRFAVIIFLGIIVFSAFWRILTNGFVNYDDGPYVFDNPHVKSGLTASGLVWAFRTTTENNWHPITWLSHMLDWELFGERAGGHHLTSLIVHILNTILLFLLLERLTGCMWRSSFAAALFGVHPLHVESVAWVAERKEVLSFLFGMLTVMGYIHYVRLREHGQSGRFAYLLSIAAYALGLMSKPMLVTLPFVLLLIDYWRLSIAKHHGERLAFSYNDSAGCGSWHYRYLALIIDKWPFFLMCLASCVVTFVAQGEAVSSLDRLPIWLRVGNAVLSYMTYIMRMVWPHKLAVFYPYPVSGLPFWKVAGSLVLLVLITLVTIRLRRSKPYLIVGWLWYLGTLVPVIGLVQVGAQASADRYTYLPLVGLFVIAAWSMQLNKFSIGVIIAALAVCTSFQSVYWHDSMTLFQRALQVTENNYLAHNNLGAALEESGALQDAAQHYERAIAIRPDDALAYNNLGNIYARLGELEGALKNYKRAVELMPSNAAVHNNLGLILQRLGKSDEAEFHYRTSIRLRPQYVNAHLNLGILLVQKRRFPEAIAHLSRATKASSAVASEAHNNIGVAFAQQGQNERAVEEFSKAIRMRPSNVEAHQNLALASFLVGRYSDAWREVHVCEQLGRKLHPEFLKALAGKLPDPARSP